MDGLYLTCGQVACSQQIVKTWQTWQLPQSTSVRFECQEVSQEETLSFPCADGTLKLLDLPHPCRIERSAKGYLEGGEDDEKETNLRRRKR